MARSVLRHKLYAISCRATMKKLLALFFILFVSAIFLGAGKPGAKKVFVKTLKNGHYQLIVDGKPFIVKGACYHPVPIGEPGDYDFWSDPGQPWLADGALMKKMGVNTVRFYEPGQDMAAVKKVIGDLYKKSGVRTIMGHWIGFWNYPAPFYDDKEFREKVKKEVLDMVRALKDEPGILFWILGNENNYSFGGKINSWSSERIDKLGDPRVCLLARAESYYSFVNEIAVEIKKIDPNHPVAMGNGELVCLDKANEVAKDVDIIGCIIYRGKTFGNIFSTLKATFDKPLVFVEFGCDAYNAYEKREDEDNQALFLESQWREIYRNLANNPEGVGNCLGGAMFEWTDEWWKHNEDDQNAWSVHDTESNWSNGSYYFDIKADRNMNMNEEWFGIVRVDPEPVNGINKRSPRKAYYAIREFWKNPKLNKKEKSKK
jgi:endo-1,4-beta-mannosidase